MAYSLTKVPDLPDGKENGTMNPESAKQSVHYLHLEDSAYALIPSHMVTMTSVEIQAKNKQDLLAALPFALEEELVEAVEQLHFVAGSPSAHNKTPVLVINRQSMHDLKNSLQQKVDYVLPESLCLPWKPETWSIAIDQNRAIIRTSEHQGFECELDQLNSLMSLHSRQNIPSAINVWMPKAVNKLDVPSSLSSLIKGYHYKASYSEWLAAVAQPAADLNLLDGQFAQQQQKAGGFRPWLPAIAICSIALIAHLVFSWMHISSLNKQADAMEQQAELSFKQAFPETKRIVNARVQAEQKLKKLEALSAGAVGNNFLYVLNDTVMVLKQIPSMKLNGFSWRQNQLQLQVTAPSVGEIKKMEQGLHGEQYTVEMLNAVNQAGQYQAQLRVSEMSP